MGEAMLREMALLVILCVALTEAAPMQNIATETKELEGEVDAIERGVERDVHGAHVNIDKLEKNMAKSTLRDWKTPLPAEFAQDGAKLENLKEELFVSYEKHRDDLKSVESG